MVTNARFVLCAFHTGAPPRVDSRGLRMDGWRCNATGRLESTNDVDKKIIVHSNTTHLPLRNLSDTRLILPRHIVLKGTQLY